MDYLYLVSTPSVNVFGAATTTTQSITSSCTAKTTVLGAARVQHEGRNQDAAEDNGSGGLIDQKGCKEMSPSGNKVTRKSLKRKTRRKVKRNMQSHHVSSPYDTSAGSSVLEVQLEESCGRLAAEISLAECNINSKTEGGDIMIKAVSFRKPQKKSRGQLTAALPSASKKGASAMTKAGTTVALSLRHQTGKENSYSVWQKVQRNELGDSDAEKIGLALKEDASFKRNYVDVSKVSTPSRLEDRRQAKHKAPKKLKRRILHLKRDICSNCRGLRVSCPHKFGLNGQNMVKCVPKLSYKNGYPKSGFQALGLEYVNSQPTDHAPQVARDDASDLAKTGNDPEYSMTENFTESQDTSLLELCNSLNENELQVEEHPVSIPQASPSNKVNQTTKEVETADFNKQSHSSSGSILQKWIPVGVREPEFTSSHGLEKTTVATDSPDQVSEDDDISNREECDQKMGNSDDSRLEQVNQGVANTCVVISSRLQELTTSEVVGWEGILKAVHDTFEMQLASEAIEVATGCPIAEFERLLHSSSPSCQTRSLDQVCHTPLDSDETPNISLQSLWQWYERHGIYGLEVRAEDHRNSNRLGIDKLSFSAYFVPFLSAVQLFGKSEGKADTQNNDSLHLVSKTSTGHKAWRNDAELLFEYFESERPQLRQPLYEKIHELARADDLAGRKMFGNPSTLVSMNLPELHKKSWFSVAWYPIYKIPDGSLRAAFLTYHSFGHLVERRSKFGSPTMVCPVVGLQSYNAQEECWFQPRHSAMDFQMTEEGMLEPSQVLKERLRTLQETASCMARASVNKGDENLVKNWHPDYEFFHSRQFY
ncbi:unnamed protein product [Linum tenue]|uniref:Uncharacterized protein n=1 Tax=Linum tenue TaxID=586396 RepID=A0AAV0IRQ0_9ROSI|nr:unnamed protein product [Linum tenue]